MSIKITRDPPGELTDGSDMVSGLNAKIVVFVSMHLHSFQMSWRSQPEAKTLIERKIIQMKLHAYDFVCDGSVLMLPLLSLSGLTLMNIMIRTMAYATG